MSVVSWVRSLFGATKKAPTHPRDPVIASWFGGGVETASGVHVTPERAMQTTAVLACVRVIAETLASLPLVTYRRVKGGKTRDWEHPLYEILHDQPNRWQTSFEYWEMAIGHVLLRGNAYAEKVMAGRLQDMELVPLHPDRVEPFFAPDGNIAYSYQPEDGPARVILASEMHHVRGMPGSSVLKGVTPISHAKESVGLSIATEEYAGRFFANDAKPGGMLQHPAKLSEVAAKNLKASWQAAHSGKNRHTVAVLEEGMTYKELGVTNKDSQFLELRKFQISEIARLFRVPPHLIGDLDRATFSNIEQQGIEFVVHTIRPWVVKTEQAIKRDLFTPAMRKTHFAQFVLDALMRGDSAARSAYYREMWNIGALSQNDIRRLENMNPIPGGDKYYTPMNMTANGAAVDTSRTEALLKSAARRLAVKEEKALAKAREKYQSPELEAWADDFYGKHAELIADALAVSLDVAMTAVGSYKGQALAGDWPGVEKRTDNLAEIGRMTNEEKTVV